MADLVEIGKQTLKDENLFNKGAEFNQRWEPYPDFYRKEPLPPTNRVFDVEEGDRGHMEPDRRLKNGKDLGGGD
jgi:aldehyde:ferredoxin oxidoreductase